MRGFIVFVWVMAGPLLTFVSVSHLIRPANAPVTCNGHEMRTDEVCKIAGKQIYYRTYDEMKADESPHPTWDVGGLVVGTLVTLGGIALAWYVLRKPETPVEAT